MTLGLEPVKTHGRMLKDVCFTVFCKQAKEHLSLSQTYTVARFGSFCKKAPRNPTYEPGNAKDFLAHGERDWCRDSSNGPFLS